MSDRLRRHFVTLIKAGMHLFDRNPILHDEMNGKGMCYISRSQS